MRMGFQNLVRWAEVDDDRIWEISHISFNLFTERTSRREHTHTHTHTHTLKQASAHCNKKIPRAAPVPTSLVALHLAAE